MANTTTTILEQQIKVQSEQSYFVDLFNSGISILANVETLTLQILDRDHLPGRIAPENYQFASPADFAAFTRKLEVAGARVDVLTSAPQFEELKVDVPADLICGRCCFASRIFALQPTQLQQTRSHKKVSAFLL